MKLALPITQVLYGTGPFIDRTGLFKRQDAQHPLNGAPSHTGNPPWDHHPGPVHGSFENWYHTTTISVGTPPQPFTAILDLGSSTLAIPSIHNPISNRTSKPLYNSSLSSTYLSNGSQVAETPFFFFGDNSGFLSQDAFHTAGLTIQNQVLTEATSVNFGDCILCQLFDTVLPLGPYNASSSSNFRSPIAQLIEQDLLNDNVFSLRLSRGTTDTDGQLALGGVVDEELYEGTFIPLAVTDDDVPSGIHPSFRTEVSWKVHAESLTLGDGSEIRHEFKSSTIAVLNTAYPWIALPHHLAQSLNEFMDAEIWGPFAWVDCSRRSEFLNLTIVLEGQEFMVSPYDYILEQEYRDEPGRLYCQTAFVPLPGVEGFDDDGVILLGHAFLRAFVTVWDLEGRSVSFATAKHEDNGGRINKVRPYGLTTMV